MSMGYRGKVTNDERDIVATQTSAERESMVGEMPGRIVKWDLEAQTATIQPIYKPSHNGTPVDMPELLEVPVRFPRAGNGALTFPVSIGDKVTLRPQMRSSENYHAGEDYTPSDSRSANLSDMEAYLDGGEPLTEPIPNFDGDNVHMRFDPEGQYGLRGSKDGKVKLEGAQGDIYALLVEVVRLLATDKLKVNYGSSAGSGHELENRAEYQAIHDKLDAMKI